MDKTASAMREARAAQLKYSCDSEPGITRVKSGAGFRYRSSRGQFLRDPRILDRIRKLAIPPAWTQVWICQNPRGHLQATGRDARGRKQYRYHADWSEKRGSTKYDRLLDFGRHLPAIRTSVRKHLHKPGLPREKVLATVVRLLDVTHIRVGNEEYAQSNGSYGLTTLQNRHAKIRGAVLRFQFAGKSGVRHAIDLHDRRLACVVKQCQDLPGQRLFQYVDDDGKRKAVTSTDVNQYLREVSGREITAKDFRTWAGTVLAASAFAKLIPGETVAATKKLIVQVVGEVAAHLGNTSAVCRKAYIHPAVIESFSGGRPAAPARTANARGLSADERSAMGFLRTLK